MRCTSTYSISTRLNLQKQFSLVFPLLPIQCLITTQPPEALLSVTPLSRLQSAVSLRNSAEPGTSRLNPADSAAWSSDGLSPWLSFLSPLTISTT